MLRYFATGISGFSASFKGAGAFFVVSILFMGAALLSAPVLSFAQSPFGIQPLTEKSSKISAKKHRVKKTKSAVIRKKKKLRFSGFLKSKKLKSLVALPKSSVRAPDVDLSLKTDEEKSQGAGAAIPLRVRSFHEYRAQVYRLKKRQRYAFLNQGQTLQQRYNEIIIHDDELFAEQVFMPLMPKRSAVQPETFRTVCVRERDGYFWPISYATTPDKMGEDEMKCHASCRSATRLYFYANPGETTFDMRDLEGHFYRDQPTAYLFRTKYVKGASCKAEPWSREAKHKHLAFINKERETKLLEKLETKYALAMSDEKTAYEEQKKVNVVLLSALRAVAIHPMSDEEKLWIAEAEKQEAARKALALAKQTAPKLRAKRKKRRKHYSRKKVKTEIIYEDVANYQPEEVKKSKRKSKAVAEVIYSEPSHKKAKKKNKSYSSLGGPKAKKRRKKKKKWYQKIFGGGGSSHSSGLANPFSMQ